MKLSYCVASPETQDPNMLALRGDLRKNFDLLAQLGYQGVELMVRDVRELKLAAFDGLALPVIAVSTGQLRKELKLSLGDEGPAGEDAITRTREVIDFAAALNASSRHDLRSVNIGTLRGPASGRDRATAALTGLAAHARSKDQRLAIEPQTKWLIDWVNTVSEALALGTGAGVLFDYYHAMLEERSPLAALVSAAPHIKHVQIAASNRKAPGHGPWSFVDLFAVLEALGYDGYVSVECLQHANAPAEAIACLRASAGQK
jgi:sugar phosphate isomerase/epimerase